MTTDEVRSFQSRGLNIYLAAAWSVFLVIGLSMVSVAEATVSDRVTGAVVLVVSVWMIRSMLRRGVRIDSDGFEIRQIRTTRIPWNRLQRVWVARSGAGYGVRIRVEGYRQSRLLPVGAFGKAALGDDSAVSQLAASLRRHLPDQNE